MRGVCILKNDDSSVCRLKIYIERDLNQFVKGELEIICEIMMKVLCIYLNFFEGKFLLLSEKTHK